ncbi:MAG: hypothetical protein ACHQRM_15455 [Bacteroidia bacterium]
MKTSGFFQTFFLLFLTMIACTSAAAGVHPGDDNSPQFTDDPKFWVNLGFYNSDVLPGIKPMLPSYRLPGAGASLNLQHKKIVYTLTVYGVSNALDFNTNFLSNNYSEIDVCAFSVGTRIALVRGSMIPRIGISGGKYDITTADLGPNGPGSGWFNAENYAHTVSSFVGVPISLSYLLSGKYAGLELGFYYHIHTYSETGFQLSLAFGKLK